MSEENKNPLDETNDRENETERESANETPIMEYRTEESETDRSAALFEEDAPTLLPKKSKKISLTAFLLSSVALILAAVMVTYTCCNSVYKQKLAEIELSQTPDAPEQLGGQEGQTAFDLFNAMLELYSFEELDEEQMMAAALKAYVYATGDEYAEYYTAEEYATLLASTAGNSEGIGINIINTTAMISGMEYKVIRVINVMKGSPAEAAGMKVGDLIYGVGIGESIETIHSLGYDVALTRLQGKSGTVAEFTALRPVSDGYEPMEFRITRDSVKTSSVYYHPLTSDSKIGVVKILQFDLTTPEQFSEAVDTLMAQGCEKFVFDVRYNPGGDLRSIEAVLSYFLSEGDVLIRTKNKAGDEDVSKVAPTTLSGDYAGCSISAEDIGKYKDLQVVILCNGSTASAAELFTATFRDYDKLNATIVGTKTFGKGSMQSIMPLMYYGYNGALKLTTAKYFPASGNGYDGEGITPDVVVELSEEAANQNIYEIADEDDNQLQKALEYLK